MQAIVLSRRPTREYDEIISLYTYDLGRIEVLAKGNKKIISKQSSFLEPFSLIACTIIPGKEIDHIAKTQGVEYFSALRLHFYKSTVAAWAAHITQILTPERVPDKTIFLTLKSWLEFLQKDTTNNSLLLDSYAAVLMRLIGFAPELEACVVCGILWKTIAHELLENAHAPLPGLYFAGGGMICGNCRRSKESTGEEISILGLKEFHAIRLLMQGDWRLVVSFPIEKKEKEQVHTALYKFAVYHSEIPLKNWADFVT
jgi:DNA repair protein RecO (recombination protein O)